MGLIMVNLVGIHLDFKPDNLVYVTDEQGQEWLKLIDFDSSEWIGSTALDANHLVKATFSYITPMRYKSPEQYSNDNQPKVCV